MKPCKKELEVPPVVSDGQQMLWCPDCEHYVPSYHLKQLALQGVLDVLCTELPVPIDLRLVVVGSEPPNETETT